MNDSITLRIPSEGEVTIPGEIANSSLSLSEIGAFVCFLAAMSSGVDVAAERTDSPELQAAMASLKAKGVVSAAIEHGTIKINITLDPVLPEIAED